MTDTEQRDPYDPSRFERLLQRLAEGRWWLVLPVLLLFGAFYFLTWVENVGDTDDVYYFSYLVENFALNYVGDPRLMLYKAMMQWLYHGLHAVDVAVSGLTVMRAVSAVSGAFAVLVFYQLLARDLKLHVYAAATATMLLATSYGFWRYAIEAEVYVPAILLLLITLRWFYRLDEREDVSAWAWLPVGAFSGLVVLFYQPNVIPLALAFTLMMLRRGNCCGLMAYGVSAAVVVIGGYYVGHLVYATHPMGLETFQEFMEQRSLEFVVWPFEPEYIIRATLGAIAILTHDFVSANWIFAHDWMGIGFQQLFAYEWFIEKQFAAQEGGWLVYPPLVLLPLLGILLLWILIRAFPFALGSLVQRRTLPYLVWVVFSGMVVWRLNPYGPEAWIMLLPPIMVLFALAVLEPAARKGARDVFLAVVVIVFVHNALSGIGILRDRLSEYAVAKMQWPLDNAGPGDVILVVDDNPLFMTMNYRSDAHILPIVLEATPLIAEGLLRGRWKVKLGSELSKDFRVVMLDEFFDETLAAGHRIIFTNDFFEGSRRRQYEGLSDADLAMLDRLRSRLKQVWHDDRLGTVYVLEEPLINMR